MSLFGQYILEREGKKIVEDNRGFATYFYVQDGVYIQDIYVNPDFRKSGAASFYADTIAEEAKAKGFNNMYGTVSPSAYGADASLKVLQAYGFKLDRLANGLIIMKKEI